MKKYLMIIAILFVASGSISGCGNKVDSSVETEKEATKEAEKEVTKEATKEDEELLEREIIPPPSFDGIDLSKMVELCNYKEMKIEKEVTIIDDKVVQRELEYIVDITSEEVEGGIIEEGDIVRVNHTGKVDGKEEKALTLENFAFKVGSKAPFDGFNEGLMGKKAGTTQEVKSKLPEKDYIEGLEGKEAIFTVEIISVKKPPKEITDEWVAENTDCKTLDEFRKQIEEELAVSRDGMLNESLLSEVWDKVLTGTTIKEYPKEAIAYGRKVYERGVKEYADLAEVSVEAMIASEDISTEEYEEKAEVAAKEIAKQMLTLNAIIQCEGLKESDNEYQEGLKQLEEEFQLSKEELIEQCGAESIRQDVFWRYVKQRLVDSVEIVENFVEAVDLSEPLPEE